MIIIVLRLGKGITKAIDFINEFALTPHTNK